MKTEQFSFFKPTLFFSILGFFLPIVPVMGLIGLQTLLTKFGVECSIAWTIILRLSIPVAITFPIVFYFYLKKIKNCDYKKLRIKLFLFNLVEYISIQVSLASFYTNGEILCYGNGGQNGLEFVFTGWMSIPILMILSFIYSKTIKFE